MIQYGVRSFHGEYHNLVWFTECQQTCLNPPVSLKLWGRKYPRCWVGLWQRLLIWRSLAGNLIAFSYQRTIGAPHKLYSWEDPSMESLSMTRAFLVATVKYMQRWGQAKRLHIWEMLNLLPRYNREDRDRMLRMGPVHSLWLVGR